MYRFSFLIFWIVIGCTWQSIPDSGSIPPNRDPRNIDLNDDGINDATLYYSSGVWDGIGSSGSTSAAVVRAEGYNSTLYKRDAQLIPHTLFHAKMDTISRNASLPQEWNNMGAHLAEIWQEANGHWPKTWTIRSQYPVGPYYVALRVQKGSDYVIGWIKVDIDVNSGEVTLLDKAFTSSEFIVIDR